MRKTSPRSELTRRAFLARSAAAGAAGAFWNTMSHAGLFPDVLASSQWAGGCHVCAAAAGVGDSPAVASGFKASRPLLRLARAERSSTKEVREGRVGGVLIIQPEWILSCENDKFKLLRDHEVVIEGDRIAEVRQHTTGRDPRLVANGQILLPGFISGHTHSCAGTLTRGFIEETSYASIQGEGHAPRARSLLVPMTMIEQLSDAEIDDLTAINLAEMLRTGCTTQVEMSLSLKQMQSYVRVATRFGIRGYPGGMVPGMARLLPIWTRSEDKVLLDSEAATLAEIAANLAYAKSVNGTADGRIRPMMAPSVVAVHTRESFAAIRRAAAELGNGVHIHVQNQWRARDVQGLRSYWGKREAEVLQEVGLLDGRLFGGHLLGADVEKDLPIYARAKQFTFAHCPSGAGAGVLPSSQPYPEALAAGVNTSIGLDTHSNDYLENIKLAMMQGRSRAQLLAKTSPVPLVEPTIWHAMESATLGAARGLGRDDLGRIQAGAKADLSTVSISGLLVGSGTRPIDPLNNLLYANGLAVQNVMTDGRWQVRDGRLLIGDEAELSVRGGAVVEKIWSQLRKVGYFDPA